MSDHLLTAPFPYFGGKRRAAPIIWRELGDPAGYVEPFAGSAAILLARPAFKGRRVRDIEHTQCYLCEWAETIELCDKRPSYTLVRACEHHRERP